MSNKCRLKFAKAFRGPVSGKKMLAFSCREHPLERKIWSADKVYASLLGKELT